MITHTQRKKIIKRALVDAIDWNESILDAIRDCHSQKYEEQRRELKELISKMKEVYKRYKD